MISLGDIKDAVGAPIPEALLQRLGVHADPTPGRGVKYRADRWPDIRAALARHIASVEL